MTRRIAMWSGPRNISTTMMRAFENRADTAVVDEPFYAHWLVVSGADHPMRDEVLQSQPSDWRAVAMHLTTDAPAPVYFQKHMCHHWTHRMDRDWLEKLDHFFLIRDPARMVASYAARMDDVTAHALGLAQEWDLFEHVRAMTGQTPAVVDASDILANPEGMLRALCAALALSFDDAMLSWPSGRRASDGVWAPHWYRAVEASTGFQPEKPLRPVTDDAQRAVIDEVTPFYERLHAFRLTAPMAISI